GLIVFARTFAAKKVLAHQFRLHTVHRRYLAIAHGDVPTTTYESRLVADRGDGLRGSTTLPGIGRRAVTHDEPVERFAGVATLVSCRLETGRTHQIRIHLSEAGHPLVGERVYARQLDERARIGAPRVMLHAAELGFVHPASDRPLSFTDEMPD